MPSLTSTHSSWKPSRPIKTLSLFIFPFRIISCKISIIISCTITTISKCVLSKCLECSRNCTKHLTGICALKPHNNLKKPSFYPQFTQEENEVVRSWKQNSGLGWGRAQGRTQVRWLHVRHYTDFAGKPCFPHPTTHKTYQCQAVIYPYSQWNSRDVKTQIRPVFCKVFCNRGWQCCIPGVTCSTSNTTLQSSECLLACILVACFRFCFTQFANS